MTIVWRTELPQTKNSVILTNKRAYFRG